MARNDTINVTSAEWTQITNANASAIRVQNLSNSYAVLLNATNGTTAPTDDGGAGQGSNLIPRLTLNPRRA